MRYFKIVVYTTGDEYETNSWYIDEPTFRKYQRAIANDVEHIIAEDRVIKRSLIKEIIPADSEIREYTRMGINLPTLGLSTRSSHLIEQNKKEDQGFTQLIK